MKIMYLLAMKRILVTENLRFQKRLISRFKVMTCS